MPYKIGDIVEVKSIWVGGHGFKKGDQVRVVSIGHGPLGEVQYKCDKDDNGRKTSWYVEGKDLVKRRAK